MRTDAGKLQQVWWGWFVWHECAEPDRARGRRCLRGAHRVGVRWRVRWLGPFPSSAEDPSSVGHIYRWRLLVGPLEVRCWGP